MSGSDRPLQRTGIVGYGRFGRALAGLVHEAGLAVAAWDPEVEVPEPIGAVSLEALARSSSELILAVPVAAVGETARALRPSLTPIQLVVDVGSVKSGPVAALTEALGTAVPWIATHPLFGPSSIALGERPLRAVVCPNPQHPDAAARIRTLYERIGCEVIEQRAEEHDRLMARTHALAFFVAKGLIDTGASDGLSFTPPSFQAMARTIDMVRTDAGHLFLSIQRENPFAADSRQRLLDALSKVHDQLEDHPGDEPLPASAFAIPDLGTQAPELRETRDLIDELDREIVHLLARRAQLARRAGVIKAEHGRSVRDPLRERSLLGERQRWADEFGIAVDAVEDIFKAILRFSREIQSQ